MIFRLGAAALSAAVLAAPAFAKEAAPPVKAPGAGYPAYVQVEGVAQGDVLNVRAKPAAKAADIGDIPPGYGPLEALEASKDGKWLRILWKEGDGWIAARFVRKISVPTLSGLKTPVGLRCVGTEPFWDLSLGADGFLTWSTPETKEPVRLALVHAAPEGEGAVLHARDGGDHLLSASIAPGACSDGMSERNYGWLARLAWSVEGGGAPGSNLSGCCFMPQAAGLK